MKSVVFLACIALVLLQSCSAFVLSGGSSRLGCRIPAQSASRSIAPQSRASTCLQMSVSSSEGDESLQMLGSAEGDESLQMSAGSSEGDEMNSLDKALIAWGVKSPPGEPDIDFKEKIKSAGLAGALAYGGTELAFWIISVPLAVVGYHQTTGEWLDLTTLEGKEKLFGLTAGFLTFARLVVPLRIALALALTPAMDKYVVKGLLKKTEGVDEVDDTAYDNSTNTSAHSVTDLIRKAEVQERSQTLRKHLFPP